MNSSNVLRIVSALALVSSIATPALAVTNVPGKMMVRMEIVAGCQVESDDIDFGIKAGIPTDYTQTGKVKISCTADKQDYSIFLGKTGEDNAARKMRPGIDGLGVATGPVINYSLYSDSAYTKAWPIPGATTDLVKSTLPGAGVPVDYLVYAKVPRQTAPTIGKYSESVDITVVMP